MKFTQIWTTATRAATTLQW